MNCLLLNLKIANFSASLVIFIYIVTEYFVRSILWDEVLTTIRTKCGKIRYKELLEMRFVNGMSEREIAKINKKDVKSISKAITAAIKSMDI